MVNVNQTTKDAYLSDSTHKAVTITFPNKNITFTNSDLIAESLTLTEAIETERTLTFTGCIASQLSFKVAEIISDLRGEYVEAKIQAEETEEIYLFRGYVDTQDNETHEDIITAFTCYDPLYKIGSKNMQVWVNSLSYPITVKTFRDGLFSNLGISQETRTLINDGLTISANFKTFVDAPSGADLMKWICQINGVYGQYGRDGVFHYRELNALSEGLYPSETTYPGETTYPSAENAGTTIPTSDYVALKYEPYTTDYITKVSIMDENGVEHGYGTNGNVFVISDNPIAFCVNMTTAARAILAKVEVVNHIPVVEMRCVGMPYLECGDTYLSYTRRYVCRTYILQRTLSGIQALFDSYSSDCDKDYPVPKVSQQNQINANKTEIKQTQDDVSQVGGRVSTVDNRVTGVDTRVTGVDTRVTGVDTRVTGVSNQVTQLGTVVAQKANITDLNATNANVNSLSANKANVSDLNATNARVGALESNTVKTWQLSAQVANILQTFSSSVSCTVCNASSYLRSAGTVYAGSFSLGAPGQATTFGSTCQVRDINGTIRTVLRA